MKKLITEKIFDWTKKEYVNIFSDDYDYEEKYYVEKKTISNKLVNKNLIRLRKCFVYKEGSKKHIDWFYEYDINRSYRINTKEIEYDDYLIREFEEANIDCSLGMAESSFKELKFLQSLTSKEFELLNSLNPVELGLFFEKINKIFAN